MQNNIQHLGKGINQTKINSSAQPRTNTQIKGIQ